MSLKIIRRNFEAVRNLNQNVRNLKHVLEKVFGIRNKISL